MNQGSEPTSTGGRRTASFTNDTALQASAATPESKDKLLRSFANGDVCDSPLNPPPIRAIRVIRGQSLLDPAPTPPPPHHATTSFPDETRELINEALSKCVERFRFPPEERDKVRRAAELGNPFGQYLWGLVCHYDLGEHLEAWSWFSRSAEHGYHDSVRHMALLMEAGLVPLKGSSRNPDTHARQVREAATELYLKAAELGSYQACFQYGICCLEGLGRPRHYLEAFHWLRLAACKDYKPAQVQLAKLHLEPKKGDYNPVEAYIWGTVSESEEVHDLLAGLEASLPWNDILFAQSEATRRSQILKEKKHLTPDEIAPAPAAPADQVPTSRKASAEEESKMRAWQATDLTRLSFDVNPHEQNVLLSYGIHRCRLSFGEFKQIFSPYALSLIVEHYKSCFVNEPPIAYDGLNLAYNVRTNSSRKNFLIVSDFNFRLRKLFSLPKSEKAFVWSSDRMHRHKSLKARVQIKVHF